MNFHLKALLLLCLPLCTKGQDTSAVSTTDLSKPLYQLSGHNEDVEVVAYAPNGKLIASGDWSGVINIYFAGKDSLLKSVKVSHTAITSLSFSKDSRYLAVSTKEEIVRMYKADSLYLIKSFDGHTNTVKATCFDKSGNTLITVSTDTTMKLWNIKSGTKRNVKLDRPATSVAVSIDGNSIIVGMEASFISVYNIAGILQRSFSGGHTDIVNSLAVSPDGKYLLSGSNDKLAILWDFKTGKLVRKFSGHSWKVQSVAFTADSRYCATGSNDGTVKLWDVDSGTLVRTLTGYGNNYKSVVFSPDLTLLVTAAPVKGGKPQGAFVWPSGFKKETPVKPGPKTPVKGTQDPKNKKKPAPGGTKEAADSMKKEKGKVRNPNYKQAGDSGIMLPSDSVKKGGRKPNPNYKQPSDSAKKRTPAPGGKPAPAGNKPGTADSGRTKRPAPQK